jgi:alpha-tubulin suppressor-like RCC1 family protein
MSCLRRTLYLAVLHCALVGCEGGSYSVEVSFAEGLNAEDAVAIDLLLLDACPSEAEVQSGTMPLDEVVQSLTLGRTQESLPRFEAVGPGDYGLYARALSASCTVLASSCVPVTLEDDGESTLPITLVSSAPLAACAATDVCTDGECIATSDKVATRVESGRAHSCALFTSSEIWCWGDNSFGQLGQGDTSAHGGPVRVVSDLEWQRLSVGWDHTCATDANNRLYCWGRPDDGRLGHDQGATALPAQVGDRSDWRVVSASARTTCGRASEDPFCWGANESGQLGVGNTEPQPAPSAVSISNFREFSIAAGGNETSGHMAILRYETVSLIIIPLGQRFDLYTAGAGLPGGNRPAPGKVLENIDSSTQISAGGEHTCILSHSRVYCGGVNALRQLGRDDTETPRQVGGEDDWTQVSAGDRHTCGRRGTTVWCWGDNGAGQSAGAESIAMQPTQVGALDGWTWVSAGVNHSCGIRSGLIYCWGSNEANQLGLGVGSPGQASPESFIDFPPG